jgi:phosphatidate phosphatase APP1
MADEDTKQREVEVDEETGVITLTDVDDTIIVTGDV